MIIFIHICLLLGILINIYFIYSIYYMLNFKSKIKYYSLENNNFKIMFNNIKSLFIYEKFLYLILSILSYFLSSKIKNKIIMFMLLYLFIFFIQSIDCGVFLQNYVDLIASDEVFLCSSRTPESDLWDSYLLIQLPSLPNRGPLPPSRDIPSKWGPGKPWGEGPNKPGGPNGPEGSSYHPTNSRSRDNELNREGFFGTVLNDDVTPAETWESYISREQYLYGAFQTDDTSYRDVNVSDSAIERSISIARNMYNSVQRGPRPRMQHLNRVDRINLTSAYWDKFKKANINKRSDFLPYGTHKAMMRGKDYNIGVKNILQSLGRL